MELQTRIGLRLQALRKAKGLTQEELAERSGKSVDTLSLVERGRILPTLDTLYALSEAVGEPITSLLPDGAVVPIAMPVARIREKVWAMLCGFDEKLLLVALAQLEALRELS